MLNKYIKYFIISIISLINLFFLSATASPDGKDYQIELIIFKNNHTNDLYKEAWPLQELTPPDNAVTITDNGNLNNNIDDDYQSNGKHYTRLSQNKLQYRNIYNRINNNSRYRTVAHMAWIQPEQDIISSKAVYLELGKKFNTVTNDLDISEAEISGTIKLSLKRYIHAKLDLLLNMPVKSSTDYKKPFITVNNEKDFDENTYLQTFVINEKRRLKDNEINYFDNPAFGAILVVSQVK